MRPDPVVEFCLGLGALLIALTMALLLAFPPAWMDGRQSASAVFADVTGLAEGANVTENGVVEGNVVSIKHLKRGVLVGMKLRPGWPMKAGFGLTIEQFNPIQAASLSVAGSCKLMPGESLKAGCCPEKLFTGIAEAGETMLASCGRTPGLIDKAMVIANEAVVVSGMATTQLKSLKDVSDAVPGIVKTTMGAVTSMKSLADNVNGAVGDNRGSLKSTLDNVNGVTGKVDTLLKDKQEQLEASITDLSNVLSKTSAAMPGIVTNLQKTAEDLRAITGQVRNQPTSVIRVRERADPSFVEPAAGK